MELPEAGLDDHREALEERIGYALTESHPWNGAK
jgi:hypothetical protein